MLKGNKRGTSCSTRGNTRINSGNKYGSVCNLYQVQRKAKIKIIQCPHHAACSGPVRPRSIPPVFSTGMRLHMPRRVLCLIPSSVIRLVFILVNRFSSNEIIISFEFGCPHNILQCLFLVFGGFGCLFVSVFDFPPAFPQELSSRTDHRTQKAMGMMRMI